MTFLRDPVPPLICCLLSTLFNAAHSHESSVFCTSLELLFCLDQASWPSILLPRSSILTLYFSRKLSSLYYLFLNSTFMYCLCWQCQCVEVSCMWERERESVCVDSAIVLKCPACERERERGMCEREIECVSANAQLRASVVTVKWLVIL